MDEKEKLARRFAIGGSEAAAVLGMSPWQSPMDVWLRKMGLVEETPDPRREEMFQLGKDMEPVIAKMYERRTGRVLTEFPRIEIGRAHV